MRLRSTAPPIFLVIVKPKRACALMGAAFGVTSAGGSVLTEDLETEDSVIEGLEAAGSSLLVS